VLRFDPVEFALAVVTLLTVAFVGVQQGIGLAVALAIVDRTRRTARPDTFVLGRVPDTTSWVAMEHSARPAAVPGVVVVLFVAPLYYANAQHFRIQAHRALAEASPPPKLFVLDADAMSDIDYTGTKVLAAFLDELDRARITFAIARAIGDVPHNLARSGLIDRIGPDHVFHTVDDAVKTLAPDTSR